MVDIRPISKEWIEFLNLKKTELHFSYNVSKRGDNQTLSQTTTIVHWDQTLVAVVRSECIAHNAIGHLS